MTIGPVLPRGATGMWEARVGEPPRTDARAFRAAVHHAALRVGGRADGFEEAGVTPNFHRMVVRTDRDETAVICHVHLPWLALVRPSDRDDWSLTFRYDPVMAEALEQVPPFRVLDLPTLATPLGRLDLSILDSGERREVAFWQPATLGELVFNWWD